MITLIESNLRLVSSKSIVEEAKSNLICFGLDSLERYVYIPSLNDVCAYGGL